MHHVTKLGIKESSQTSACASDSINLAVVQRVFVSSISCLTPGRLGAASQRLRPKAGPQGNNMPPAADADLNLMGPGRCASNSSADSRRETQHARDVRDGGVGEEGECVSTTERESISPREAKAYAGLLQVCLCLPIGIFSLLGAQCAVCVH